MPSYQARLSSQVPYDKIGCTESPVAQLAEQIPVKNKVRGSSPRGGALQQPQCKPLRLMKIFLRGREVYPERSRRESTRGSKNMLETNSLIVAFLTGNFFSLAILLASLIKVIPPEWAGFWKYNNNNSAEGKAQKITALNWLLHMIFASLVQSFFIPLIAAFGLKNMVTLVILMVVGFDIFSRKQVSTASVTLTAIGIIALYLDRLVETGKTIKLFGGLLLWERKDDVI